MRMLYANKNQQGIAKKKYKYIDIKIRTNLLTC